MPEAYPPFYQYPIAAEPVSAYHDNTFIPQQPTAVSPTEGEYPGISNVNAPISQMPNLGGMPNAGYQPYGTFPQGGSPESYGNTFYPQTMDWGHPGPIPGSPNGVMPASYSVSMMPGYPSYSQAINQAPIANEPLKGEVGGLENMKGHFDREAQAAVAGEGTEEIGLQKTEPQSKTPASSKKNVKISGSLDSPSTSKKQSKSGTGTAAPKKRARSSKTNGRRNPWINA